MPSDIDDVFWDQMGLMGGAANQAGVSALVMSLSALKDDEIFTFADDLADHLRALDGQGHGDAATPSQPSGPDSFLYLRCAVVAAGASAFEAVPADPRRISEYWAAAEEAERGKKRATFNFMLTSESLDLISSAPLNQQVIAGSTGFASPVTHAGRGFPAFGQTAGPRDACAPAGAARRYRPLERVAVDA